MRRNSAPEKESTVCKFEVLGGKCLVILASMSCKELKNHASLKMMGFLDFSAYQLFTAQSLDSDPHPNQCRRRLARGL